MVPRFESFAGVRYDPEQVELADVIAPPYDVISAEDGAALQSRSPYNAVRVELPDPEPGLDGYQAAAERLRQWLASGVLRGDEQPALYGYQMTYHDDLDQPRQTVGVIGALGLEPPGQGSILPHEHTTPKARSDRLELLRATRTNLSPIWGLSTARGLSDAVGAPPETGSSGPVMDSSGVSHELWPIVDPARISAIAEIVASAPMLIADGHHRYETAVAYQAERRAATSDQPGPYDLVMALVVELVEDQLSVQGIHRLVSGLPEDFDLVSALGAHFFVSATEPVDATIGDRMSKAEALGLVTAAGTWLLHPRPETLAAADQDLDSTRLDVALAALPEHELVYQHGWDLAAAAVASGEAQAAVLLRPVTVQQIAATGRGGAKMPPKTTFFWPKLRTGLVFRQLPG